VAHRPEAIEPVAVNLPVAGSKELGRVDAIAGVAGASGNQDATVAEKSGGVVDFGRSTSSRSGEFAGRRIVDLDESRACRPRSRHQ